MSIQHDVRANEAHVEKVNLQLQSDGVANSSVPNQDGKEGKAKVKRQAKLEKFNMTLQQKQLSSQAQWYVYSDQKISKRSFEDPYFKKMMQVINKLTNHVCC